MKRLIFFLNVLLIAVAVQAKTLVVYYSYTNNVENIVNALTDQIEADVLEIEPAEKGLDYAANNYAIGSNQIAAIRDNPNDASSYPAIDPVSVSLDEYDTIIVGAPLWWSNMAAPMQSFLFQYGKDMAGKNIGLIVSSSSSGISGVESDAKRLIPEGNLLSPSLWIRSSQVSSAKSMLKDWLKEINYSELCTSTQNNVYLTANGKTRSVTLSDNSATTALKDLLKEGDITVRMSDYGGFEKVGALPQALPTSNSQITTQPGDIMLYQGNQMVIFYGSNSWSYTPLGKINDATSENVKEFLGDGSVEVTVSLTDTSGIEETISDTNTDATVYDLSGRSVKGRPLAPGIYIINRKKVNIR